MELGENARKVIYKFSNILSRASVPQRLTNTGASRDVNIHPTNLNIFVFLYDSLTEPTNIYLYRSSNSMTPLTTHNKNLMDKVKISNQINYFSFRGALNDRVWGWHIAPTNGTNKKAPLVYIIHSGPYISYFDEWIYYSNLQIYASRGYATVAINYHGSDSYGQRFSNSVRGRQATLPYEDLQLGLAAVLNLYPYIDGNRAVAIGFGFGGYLTNWIAGQPEFSRCFKTLISEAGIFDIRSMVYTTDLVYATEDLVGGFTPYENPAAFENFNPINRVDKWTQPMLFTHGNRDYRIPDTQSIAAFTAAQRRGITSRLIYLSASGHFNPAPLNSIRVHQEVLEWMDQWT